MQTTYKKLTLLLKGSSMGILTLEQRDTLHYTLTGNRFPADAALVLFFKDGGHVQLPVPQGTCPQADLSQVVAAALLHENAFPMTAQTEPFDWTSAQQLLYTPQVQTVPMVVNEPLPPQKTPHESDCPCLAHTDTPIDPFPLALKGAKWRRVEYPYFADSSHYLIGEIFRSGKLVANALAVPGEYAVNPPSWLTGFDSFLRSQIDQQGYWLFIKDVSTGKPASLQQFSPEKMPG